MPLEYEAIRKSFNSIADQYEDNAFLQKEVLLRLLERLQDEQAVDKHMQVKHVLDLGCGTGFAIPELFKQFGNIEITGLDFSQEMLNQIEKHKSLKLVHADVHDLPFADNSYDIVFSNMMLHWSNEQDVFAECLRVLKPNGTLLMSCLGETSLFELKQAWKEVDDHVHVHPFPALHHLGDELLKVGFQQVVVNAEVITLTYKDIMALMKDIKASGGHNSDENRTKGLLAKARLKRLTDAYELFKQDGRLPASYEIVYLRAKKAMPLDVC
jgi:malonyl-CoA O-methyltransferase